MQWQRNKKIRETGNKKTTTKGREKIDKGNWENYKGDRCWQGNKFLFGILDIMQFCENILRISH